MKNVLVTGGAGFIGSHFVKQLVSHEDWNIVNVDALTYAGSLENLKGLEGRGSHIFSKGDITDQAYMMELFETYDFDFVINFAAESHVDKSISDPGIFIKTNVLGTQCLLDCAREHWRTEIDGQGRPVYKEGVKFLQVSTDEVYGPSNDEAFTEDSPLLPSSPYAASKAAADLIVRACGVTYGLPFNITRSSNNYGPGQHSEKLIPLAVRYALNDEPVPVYGDGMQQRDWIYVKDNCNAIEAALLLGRAGEIYNIGSGIKRANHTVISAILKALGKPESLKVRVRDRLGHDRRYAIDTAKAKLELGWKPHCSFEQGIIETVEWYVSNKERL